MAHNAYTFRCRVRHWHHYNQALIARGGITFWIDEAALTTWQNTQARLGSGAPRIYSDTAIHCTVVVKSVFRLILRATQGFVSTVMSLMRLDLLVPNYSTICRRQGSLTVSTSPSPNSRPHHIVSNATGPRVYGAREWHVQKHRWDQRGSWRKLHLGVDEQTKEIVAVEITASHVHDSQVLPRLLTQVSSKVCQVSGDGAYDTKACYESIGQRGAKATFPPRRNAKQMRCSHPPNPDEPEPSKAKESSGVRRQAKPQAKNGKGTFQSTEECRFQKVGFVQQGLHPLDRQGFWNITKIIFAEKHGTLSLRD